MAEKEYIEREAAIDSLLGWAEQLAETYGKNDEYVLCLQSAAYNIEQIPAADVRPVVRGKWMESKSMMEVVYCSECGFRTIYGAMPDGLGRNYSYCPNCGADMREWNAMQTKPITNADHVRAMSDEELAEFMWAGCDNITQEACKSHAGCVDCWLDWLREAKDGEQSKPAP